MFHIASIEIPAKDVWGGVYSLDVQLPAKIRQIKSLLPLVTVDLNSFVYDRDYHYHSLTLAQEITYIVSKNYKPESEKRSLRYNLVNTNDASYQTGSLSILANNKLIVLDSTPTYIMHKLRHKTFNANRIDIDNVVIPPSSTLKMTYQERHFSPFLTDSYLTYDGKSIPSYTVSLYIEYSPS